MSSRQIRKLKQQREAEEARLRQEAEEAASDDESEEESFAPPPKPSMFSAFAGLEDEGDDDDDEDEDEKSTPAPIAKETAPVGSDSDDEPVSTPAKKTKKPKKKKKKAAKAKATPKEDSDQDIDAALAALNIKAASSKTAANEIEQPQLDPEYERVCALLGINNQHLKVANEMRNLFGRTATDNRDDDGAGTPRGGRRRQRVQEMDLEAVLKGRHAPGKGFPELTLRRNLFIAGKDEWPRAPTGGLTMEVVGAAQPDGTQEFRFVHDQMYEQTQQQFRMFVEMGDPQNLISLLVRNPYNVSLLIQVSKIAKDQSDHSLSNDLLERALFTLARATTSAFGNKLKEGKARMDFARPENRELWLAGHQYIKSLVMKGTYRTALEWAKLLLALDPLGDPYCMHLVLHHLAYRAHEHNWLIDYGKSSMLDPISPAYYSVLPTMALSHMSLKQPKESRTTLREAIMRTPFLFHHLFKELNLDPVPAAIWGTLALNEAEELFSDLYVRQTKDLWNTPEATSLLMEVAHSLQKGDIDPFIYNTESLNLNVARFVYLDNTPALMALMPTTMMHRPVNSDSDPLPPDMEDNKFSWPSQKQAFARAGADAEAEGLAGAMEGHTNPLQALRELITGRRGEHIQGEELDEEAQARMREVVDGFEEAGVPLPIEEGREGEGRLRSLYRLLFGGGDAPALVEESDGMSENELDMGPTVQVRSVSEESEEEEEMEFQRHARRAERGEHPGLSELTRREHDDAMSLPDEEVFPWLYGQPQLPEGGWSLQEVDDDDEDEYHSANEFEEWDEEAFIRAQLERREPDSEGR